MNKIQKRIQQKEKSRLKSMKQTKQRVGEFAILLMNQNNQILIIQSQLAEFTKNQNEITQTQTDINNILISRIKKLEKK